MSTIKCVVCRSDIKDLKSSYQTKYTKSIACESCVKKYGKKDLEIKRQKLDIVVNFVLDSGRIFNWSAHKNKLAPIPVTRSFSAITPILVSLSILSTLVNFLFVSDLIYWRISSSSYAKKLYLLQFEYW